MIGVHYFWQFSLISADFYVSLMFSADLNLNWLYFIFKCPTAHVSLFSSSVRCCECSASLSHWYYEKDGRLFCKKHYWAKFGELCHGCNDPITTGLIMVRGSILWLSFLITSVVLCLLINLKLQLRTVTLAVHTNMQEDKHMHTRTPASIHWQPHWRACANICTHARRICARPVTDPDAFACFIRLLYRPPVKVGAVVVT